VLDEARRRSRRRWYLVGGIVLLLGLGLLGGLASGDLLGAWLAALGAFLLFVFFLFRHDSISTRWLRTAAN